MSKKIKKNKLPTKNIPKNYTPHAPNTTNQTTPINKNINKKHNSINDHIKEQKNPQENEEAKFNIKALAPLLATLTFTLLLAIFWDKYPSTITPSSWQITLIFLLTIALIISNVMPIGLCAIISIIAATSSKSMTVGAALGGFASPITWLVICAFFLSEGIVKTGLGHRLAYIILSRFGSSIWGVSYSIICTELLISPLIPSASARSGGIMLPIATAISEQYHKNFGNDIRLNKFFTLLLYHCNVITSTIFLTSMAANPLAVAIAEGYGVKIGWLDWFCKAALPGLLSLAILPPLLFWLIKPQKAKKQDVRNVAQKKLQEINKTSTKEWAMVAIFSILITSWMTEKITGINPTLSAMCALVMMILMRVIEWRDIIKSQNAWDCLIWYGTLVMMADAVSKSGSFSVATSLLRDTVINLSPSLALLAVVLFYTHSHYLFASTTAHIMTLLSISIGISVSLGADAKKAALTFAFLSIISAGYTHYGLSSGPALFATQHLKVSEWWKLSALITNLNVLIWYVLVWML